MLYFPTANNQKADYLELYYLKLIRGTEDFSEFNFELTNSHLF